MIDPILKAHADIIKGFSFVPPHISNVASGGVKRTVASDYSKIQNLDVEIFGIQPGFFEATAPGYLEVDRSTLSELSLGEQLYTASGT